MQYHLNGFQALQGHADPHIQDYATAAKRDFQTSLPTEVDVLIVGAGPAGHLLGAQLAQFPDITTRIIESNAGPLQQGRADGLQCRTIEIFEAFGFSERVLKEGYWVNETTFWTATEDGKGLRRSGRIRDTEEDLSEFPHVILNQARLQALWQGAMKWGPTRLEPSYARRVVDIKIPDEGGLVSVAIERLDEGVKEKSEMVLAKYVVGCDGARSVVRQCLGLTMQGEYTNKAWGVLDALVVTDFPDIRLKTAIHSANNGSILIIPREGGYLVRLYIELETLEPHDRIANKGINAQVLVDRARRIFHPFSFEAPHVGYWSVYEVGQRLTNHFDNVPPAERSQRHPQVFIAGDACHTHSAKAGQGMNVSMSDAFNLGWKLASVLRGQSHPRLLHTYSEERHAIAKLLIDFDKTISTMFVTKPQDRDDGRTLQDLFSEKGRFMAGLETQYRPSLITSSLTSHQGLATGFPIGRRFHSGKVVRLADAKSVHLGHVMRADGRWRIVLFGDGGNPTSSSSQVAVTCQFLSDDLVPKYTPPSHDMDSIFDVRAVFSQPRQTIDVSSLPKMLLPAKGKFGVHDYEKAFTDEPSYGSGFGDIYNVRGICKTEGCIIVVRPDQYVSAVLPLATGSHTILDSFFSQFMIPV